MKKFKEFLLSTQAILVYILSFIFSLLLSPLFGKLYIKVFNPPQFGGFFTINDPNALFDGTFFAYFLFLPFFTFLLVIKKKWLIWAIGIILPMLVAFSGGTKDTFWAIILSAIGWGLAQAVNLARKKLAVSK